MAYNSYDAEEAVSMYAEFHYGKAYLGVPNFPTALVDRVLNVARLARYAKALDIGCSVGRASFELARVFEQVDGVDLSTAAIQCANQLRVAGSIEYSRRIEGHIFERAHFNGALLGLPALAHKITFQQGDACDLDPDLHSYDLVFAANLLDRLNSPEVFLGKISARISVGGILALASPYTWMQEFTPHERWLARVDGQDNPVSTLARLKEVLGDSFTMECDPDDIPLVIRETSRKFQYVVSQLTLWRKR